MSLLDWSEYALAYAGFAATHFLPTQRAMRARMIAALGRRTYFSVYGAISLLMLVWLISAAGRAPYVELWPQAGWTRWIPQLVMPVAFLLAVAGVRMTYPFTLGSRRARPFDPADPGLAAVTRHPVLWALVLWSGAHLPPNGDFARALMFGGFALIGLVAMPVFDMRAQNALSAAESGALFGATARLSLRVLSDGNWWRRNGRSLALSLAIAVVVWAIVISLHQPVTGAFPFP